MYVYAMCLDLCLQRDLSIETSMSIYVCTYIHAPFHYSAVILQREVSNISVILNNLQNSEKSNTFPL